jgi:hypothetical protein
MSLFHRLASMLLWIVRRHRAEQRLDNEIRSFVEMAIADKVRDGIPAAEARRLALLELGGVDQVKERVRTGRQRWRWGSAPTPRSSRLSTVCCFARCRLMIPSGLRSSWTRHPLDSGRGHIRSGSRSNATPISSTVRWHGPGSTRSST